MKLPLSFSLFTLLTFSILMSLSCKKEHIYMNNAEIIGSDPRMCACCGGAEIVINSVPDPGGPGYFLVAKFPANFNFGNNQTYPIAVKIDWLFENGACGGKHVIITRIEKR